MLFHWALSIEHFLLVIEEAPGIRAELVNKK